MRGAVMWIYGPIRMLAKAIAERADHGEQEHVDGERPGRRHEQIGAAMQ